MDAAEFAVILDQWQRAICDVIGSGGAGEDGVLEGEAGDASGGGERWALVGIKRRGAILAGRVRESLVAAGHSLPYGEVDISLYRDDYHLQHSQPRVLGTEIPFAVDGMKILLVDDVLFTGRTVRAAIDLLLDFGRPRVIQLAVFIDRGHRELPIAADLTGKIVVTQPGDRVKVRLAELGEADGVRLILGAE